jgi:hypothetical protein
MALFPLLVNEELMLRTETAEWLRNDQVQNFRDDGTRENGNSVVRVLVPGSR